MTYTIWVRDDRLNWHYLCSTDNQAVFKDVVLGLKHFRVKVLTQYPNGSVCISYYGGYDE